MTSFLMIVYLLLCRYLVAFNQHSISCKRQFGTRLIMKIENDAFRKANRAMRQAGADERMVELIM